MKRTLEISRFTKQEIGKNIKIKRSNRGKRKVLFLKKGSITCRLEEINQVAHKFINIIYEDMF